MGAARLGRYKVLKHLASGGMADVMLGRSDGIEGFERHVVLKRIRAEHAKDQRFIQMFLDEARTAAGLHHQNIVQVHDIGESDGEFFFAMEYIHGEDLRKILSAVSKTRTHMPLGYVVAIISSVAAGLHHAHERRGADKRPLDIVHRDVSPSNVLVGYDGSVKIVDFGIAKAAMRQVETKSGSLKGKVSYMSPEQCKGDSVDRRSDVYALGVVLYELATTTRLFKGENDYLMMDAIVNGKVPLPRTKRADLPNELSAIIMRCLTVDLGRRYQSCDELRIALDQFAIKAGLTASTSALATYMFKLFGARPEPWLDTDNETSVDTRPIDVDAPTEAARNSWTEMPRDEIVAATDEEKASESAKTRTDGKRRLASRPMASVEIALDNTVVPIGPSETRTSGNLGWEQRVATRPMSPRRRAAIAAMIGLPMLALAGVATWQVALRADGEVTTTSPIAMTAPAPAPVAVRAPAPVVEPIPAPPAAPVAQVPVAAVAPRSLAIAAAPIAAAKASKRPPAKVAAAQTPELAPATPVAVPVVAAPAAAPAPAVIVAPAPEPPKEVETPMAQLSSATVSAVASDHGRELAKCEGTSDVHGEVAVSFQIDASGKVVKSQLSSSIKNPKLTGCILKAVQGWHFPRPPAGAAKGLYSINYQ